MLGVLSKEGETVVMANGNITEIIADMILSIRSFVNNLTEELDEDFADITCEILAAAINARFDPKSPLFDNAMNELIEKLKGEVDVR